MANRLLLDPASGAKLLIEKGFPGVLLLGVPGMAQQVSNIQVQAVMSATLENVIDDDTVTVPAEQGQTYDPPVALTSGTGKDQFDRAWQDQKRTISASGSENIDLFDLGSIDIGAGVGKDAVGQARSDAELVGLMVIVDKDSVGELLIGGEGSAAAFNSIFNGSDTAELGPFPAGSCVFLFNPADPAWAIADAANHLLKFAESSGSGSVTYTPITLTRSA